MSSSGQPQRWHAVRKLGLAVVVAAVAQAALAVPGKIFLLELPAEGARTYRAIHSGGPFAFPKDGSVFGNRERLLPDKERGFYREYTVKTPGTSDRGARRIICGGMKPTAPEACYYTADHYASFRRIVE